MLLAVLSLPAPGALHRPASLARTARHRPSRCCAATSSPTVEATRQSAALDLWRWVEQAGGSAPEGSAVAIEVTASSGLGLRTTRAVKQGDVLLDVPERLVLSAESALRSSIGQWLADFDPWLADYAFISVALMHERRLGDQSEYASWLSSEALPASADVPLLWSADEQAEMAASTTAPFESRLADMREDYAWLQENVFDAAPVVFPSSVFSFDEYVAAHALAFSRSVVLSSGGEARPAMLPLLDLANHAAQPTARVSQREAKAALFGGEQPASVELVAAADLPAGEAVCLRYGGATAGELLLDYGFVEPNPPPVVSLEFEIDEEDRNYDDKCDVLENEAGLGVAQPWLLSAAAGGEPPAEMLAFLRMRHLGAADAFLLEAIFRQALWQEHAQLPVSPANEEAALRDGLERCHAALAGFAGSVQADLGALAEAEGGSAAFRMATVRYSERRALEASARWFEGQLERLSGLEYYQDRRLRSLGLEPIETAEEIATLAAEANGSMERAGGRRFERDIEW